MAEQIKFRCVACNKAVTVPAATAGRRGKCKRCGAVNTVPRPLTAGSVAPPGAAPTSASPAHDATQAEAEPAVRRRPVQMSGRATTVPKGLYVGSWVIGQVGSALVLLVGFMLIEAGMLLPSWMPMSPWCPSMRSAV